MATRRRSKAAQKKRNARGAGSRKARSRGLRKRKGKARSQTRPVNLVIRRTSGRVEKFDSDRMAQVVSRSGTPFMLAKDVAKSVSKQITKESNKIAREVESNKSASKSQRKSVPRTIEVDGMQVRKMVAEELKNRNYPEIASSLEGERPENMLQGKKNILDRARQPLSDSEAAVRSKLRYDSSTPAAKSTRPSSMK